MVRFRMPYILFVLAMIPIGVCFVIGACGYTEGLLWELCPSKVQEGVYQRSGPDVAYDFLTAKFGATQYWAVSITRWAGFIFVAVVCGMLGGLRLPVATITAWSLAAAMPLTIVFDTFFVRVASPDCLLTAISMCLCMLAWGGMRWVTNRWLYSRHGTKSSVRKTQIAAFAILAIGILITSLNGWFAIELGRAFGEAFADMHWIIM